MRKLLFYLLCAVPILGFGQTKISDMPAATTPTGTELVPIVQGGANKKATINQINSGYIKTADFYTIGDGRWLKLPSAPGSGQNGQSVRWNNGTVLWEYFTASAGYPGAGIPLSTGSAWGTSITDNSANWNAAAARTFSNGLTETGGAVSLGGSLTGSTTIDFDDNSLSFDIGGTGGSFNVFNGATGIFSVDPIGGILVSESTPLSFNQSGELRFKELPANGSNYVGFKAPDNISTNKIFTLPNADGSSGYLLSTNGSGVLSWAAPSGGGGLTVGTSTITSGTNGYGFYNNSGVLGEFAYGTGVRTWLTTPSWTNFNSAITGTAPFYSLASGGTATGTNTFAMGSNPFILTSGVTTGTGATAGIQNVFNSLTTGNGLDISSSSVSSGAIIKITGTGTAAASNTQRGLVVDVSGANATSTQTTYGGYFSNTKTGTSSTNIAGYFNASGGTNNLAIYAPSGIVTLGSTGAGYNGRLYSTAGTGGRVALLGNLEISTSAGASWTGTGIQAVGSNRKITFYGGNWGTDNDQVDVSWASTGVNRSGVDLGVFKSSLGIFGTAIFQANSIAAFRFIDTWPTLTTPLNVVYGFDYSAGGAGNAVSEVAIRATRGQVVLGATGTSSANDRVKINGIGTTTGKGLVVNNSSGTERFSVQDNGVINVNGSGGTAGQVLVSNGTGAAAWGTPTVNITGSNQRYQTQVANISSSLVASGTGFTGLSNTSEYANKSVLSVDFVIAMIKNDGTAVVYGKLTSIFRKDNSGTWTADVPGTPTISDITQLSGFVGDINGGVPGITWTTPGTTSGTWQLGYTAAISSTTN